MKCLAICSDKQKILFRQLHIIIPTGERIKLPIKSRVKAFMSRLHIIERLFRLEPRCSAFLNEDTLVLTFQRQLSLLSITEKRIIKTIPLRFGFSDILSFCQMTEYGENILYYGDYGINDTRESINIYSLNSHMEQKIVYTFPEGSIKHIHNIIYDKWRNQFVIFTGDKDKESGIYLANRTFSNVSLWKGGSQQFRAVIGKVTENALIYATDAVMEDNSLYSLPFTSDAEPSTVATLPGSVIYGCIVSNGFIFSTTVEPYPSKRSRLFSILDNRRGTGIKDNKSHLYHCSDNGKLTELQNFEKDLLPMRLFQYGCVQFPALQSVDTKEITCNPVAVTNHDGKTLDISFPFE